jgi:hypothetical protein
MPLAMPKAQMSELSTLVARVPPAGVPKDGNRLDQRFHTGSLVVEGRFGLTPLG